MNIGLLMISGEDDVLEQTLDANCEFVDWFYALDGTVPNTTSRRICEAHPKCADYITDADLPRPRFSERPVDGYRQALYELAVADHGFDDWFLLLHGDEVWTGLPDLDSGYDGYSFPLPFYFPRAGEQWDHTVGPLEQLRWHLGPGYPEFRMFHGHETVRFLDDQHFNVTPFGLQSIGWCDKPIRHYLYRSPASQRARAQQHLNSGFDPDNYRHIILDDAVYWTDEMIDQARARNERFFSELSCV